MWQAAGNAARAAGRFARRHRRAIVVGGVVGAAACVYHSMKKALKEAEEEHAAMLLQAGNEARRRQCLTRTRGECVAALANFLPALRKRLFLAVDVTGPVRELKALRTGSAATAAAGAGSAAGEGTGGGGGDGSGTSSGGGTVAADGSEAAAEAADLKSREVELWEKVKVTALTRLVVSLYACSALALMLHMQLHILGRLSFEESRELLERANPAASGDADDDETDATSPTAAAEAPGQAPSPLAASEAGSTCPRGGGGGLALSMEARHALLSATYEHVLGDGLRALVRDVERAVSRCTHNWRAHTRQQVEFQDLVAVIRRVRREVEGPVGGTDYYYHGGGGGEGFGRPPGVRHALLLRYIINPPDGIDGGAAPRTTTAQQAPTNDATLEGVGFGGGGSPADGRVSVSSRDEGAGSVEAVRALPGVGEVLDETWDTAESPNFAAALQSCLDATFGMVYEQLRQKAFCRGTAGAGRRLQQQQQQEQQQSSPAAAVGTPTATVVATNGTEGAGGGRAAPPPWQSAGRSAGPVAAAGDVGGGEAAAAAAAAEGGAGSAAAPAVSEREESAQVLATVISQAKLVVSEILEPSSRNEYAHAMAALPAVQDLCFSVFGSGGGRADPAPLAAARPDAAGEGGVGAGAGHLREMPPAGLYPGGCVANGGSVDGRETGGPPRGARQRAR